MYPAPFDKPFPIAEANARVPAGDRVWMSADETVVVTFPAFAADDTVHAGVLADAGLRSDSLRSWGLGPH